MKAVIKLDVPEWQIGSEVTVYFKDTMIEKGICEKEQEVTEITVEEWHEWKTKSKRDPICMLWENDTSPMWILNPNDVHEPALLMGKLKLFTGKPTFEQCKAMKWDEQFRTFN